VEREGGGGRGGKVRKEGTGVGDGDTLVLSFECLVLSWLGLAGAGRQIILWRYNG